MVEAFSRALQYLKENRLGLVLPQASMSGLMVRSDGRDLTPEAMAWLETLHGALQTFFGQVYHTDGQPLVKIQVRNGLNTATKSSKFTDKLSSPPKGDDDLRGMWLAELTIRKVNSDQREEAHYDIHLTDFGTRPVNGVPPDLDRKLKWIARTMNERSLVVPGKDPVLLVRDFFAAMGK